MTVDLQRGIGHQVYPPAGLGSGAGSLPQKFAAYLWQVRLLCKDPADIDMHLGAAASLTNDFGTEHQLPETAKLPMHGWLGTGCSPSDIQADGDADNQMWIGSDHRPDGMSSCKPSELYENVHMFDYSIDIAGMMHVCDNANHEVCKGLKFWKWFIQLLAPLSRTLHYWYSRERLVRTCGIQTWGEVRKRCRNLRMPLMTDWRWGSLVAVLARLFTIEQLLRTGFSEDALSSAMADKDFVPLSSDAAGNKKWMPTKHCWAMLRSRQKQFLIRSSGHTLACCFRFQQ